MSVSPVLFIAVIGLAGAVFMAALALVPSRSGGGHLLQRLTEVVAGDSGVLYDEERDELERPLSERIVQPLARRLGKLALRFSPQEQIDLVRHQLALAGSTRRPEGVLATRLIGGPVGVVIGILLVNVATMSFPLSIGIPVALGATGYLAPTSMLARRIKQRQREIRSALPSVLDLLTVSMEAGLSFENAMMRVAESEPTALGLEFQKVLNEIRLGRTRSESLEALAERIEVDELSSFVRAVTMAEPLGVSVANVLRIQSEDVRRLRRQRAEQAGHRAPVLMLLPMLGCIFPTIFIMLLGPAVLSVFHSLGH